MYLLNVFMLRANRLGNGRANCLKIGGEKSGASWTSLERSHLKTGLFLDLVCSNFESHG